MPFDTILTNTLKNEGSEPGKEADGTPVRYGIQQKTYDSLAPKLGLDKKSVNDLKYGEVRKIYEEEYFKKPRLNEIPSERIQGVVFDHGVNSGAATAVRKLQEIVGAKPDGIMGKQTGAKVASYIEANGEDALVGELLQARLNHYQNLIAQDPEKYGQYERGWTNRISAVAEQNKAR